MKNHLILHGHFYQPPREDPWTGLVPFQESALPFHDWNRRITRECYAANAASRFLRYDGRIEDIVNNYEVLSFNFGPTLLGWLRTYAPHIHEAIVEADKLSRKRNNGHGNAIAQSYNHSILPLDSEEDARLQIRWGLRDFYSHFGRDAEGMWLPETAVNEEVLDLLIEEGMKYVILSPWQAKRIQADGTSEAVELEGEPAPSWRPYRIERPGGTLAAFFYNHELASGISFEHYLQSADSLYTRLLSYHNDAHPGYLIHTATDGEVYGHHEPFGDMCIAALRKHVDRDQKFVFTNYAAYLEQYSPEYSAELKKGEEEKGTSWSCFHGVSRWYKDCGCSTGGKPEWNQKWRTPLRRGFESLSAEMREIYRRKCAELSGEDPESVLTRYIDVKTGIIDRDQFARQVLSPGEDETRRTYLKRREDLFTLLEGNVYRMYMFTSCGWFFADLSGLEPVQNMLYAHKAARLYRPYAEELGKNDILSDLRSYLHQAHSNLPAYGRGTDILDDAADGPVDGIEAASYFFIILLVSGSKEIPRKSEYGYFSLKEMEVEQRSEHELAATIRVVDRSRERSFFFRFAAEQNEEEGLTIRVDDLLAEGETFLQNLSKLPRELRNKIRGFLVKSTEQSFSDIAASLFEQVRYAIVRSAELEAPPSSTITKTAEISIHSLIFSHLPDTNTAPSEESAAELEKLFDFAATYGIGLETGQIQNHIADYMWSYAEKLHGGMCGPDCDILIRILNAVRRGGIEPDLTIPQKTIFAHAQKWRERLGVLSEDAGVQEAEGQKAAAGKTGYGPLGKEEREEVYRVIGVCNATGIYADDLMHRVSELESP